MNVRQSDRITPKLVKVTAAIVIGLSIGALLPPDPYAINAFGTLPGLVVGGMGVAVGAMMYTKLPELVGEKRCGCTGDCGCAP